MRPETLLPICHRSFRPMMRASAPHRRAASPWQLAVQRIHPAEPDILGVLEMVQLAVRDDRLALTLRQIEMSNFCRRLLFPCLNTRFEGTEFGELFLM